MTFHRYQKLIAGFLSDNFIFLFEKTVYNLVRKNIKNTFMKIVKNKAGEKNGIYFKRKNHFRRL